MGVLTLELSVIYVKSGRQDLNLRPLRPEQKGPSQQILSKSEVTTGDVCACTSACTSEAEIGQKSVPEGVVEPQPAEQVCSDNNPAILLQKYPELAQVIAAWPRLAKLVRLAVLALIKNMLAGNSDSGQEKTPGLTGNDMGDTL